MPRLRRNGLLLVVVLGSFACPLGMSSGDDSWKKNFETQFASTNSWEKAAAIKALDPTNKDALKLLFQLAQSQDWYLRNAVIDVLAQVTDDKVQDALKKEVAKAAGQEVYVAECICGAWSRASDPKSRLDDLVDAIKKGKEWPVRRAAAIALGNIPDKKAVQALVDELDKDKAAFVVIVHVLEALEKVTGNTSCKTPADWKSWWASAGPTWQPPTTGDKKDDDSSKPGDVIHTTVRGTNLDARSRGRGMPLLVLPEYGYEKDYLETWLRGLEDTNQIIYVKLPKLSDFSPALEPEKGQPEPYYPIDKFVDALEDFRKGLVKDKKLADKPFAIFGHGITAWIAIRYASKYPDSVRRIVLCSTYGSDRDFGKDLQAMEKAGRDNGDKEMEHYAQSLQLVQGGKPKYSATSAEEELALMRKGFSTFFANVQDLEIGRIFGPMVQKDGAMLPAVLRNMGGCIVPPFDVAKEPQIMTPTLIVCGDHSFFGTPDEANALSTHYPQSRVEVFENCGRMPLEEDNKHFTVVMEKFLH